MNALIEAVSRQFPATEIEILKVLATLCAAGLFVPLLFLTYGLDLSYGFF
jgi:hypothetical protein